MNDRLKYRVWDKRLNRYLGKNDPTQMLMENGNLAYLDDEGMKFYEVEFCTGLTDENGKLIYEGDIVAEEYYNGKLSRPSVVKYGKFNCSCCNGVYGWYFEDGDIREVEEYIVIGNIHENKDLLDEKYLSTPDQNS